MVVKYTRIQEKIKEIEVLLQETKSIMPERYETYKNDKILQAASERYFEKIIEASSKLSSLVVQAEGLVRLKDLFQTLYEARIISKEVFVQLKKAKGMRNILVHQYESIDGEVVFATIQNDLPRDIKKFLDDIKAFY